MEFDKDELLMYMRSHRLVVVSTIGAMGEPQSALVGIAVSPQCEVIFDTVADSRKHANLLRYPRASIVFAGPAGQTLQIEGVTKPVSVSDVEDSALRAAYYDAWPDGRARLAWPNLTYWCIMPKWARYSDFDRGPLIAEFAWP